MKALGLTRTTWCVLLAIGNEDLTQPSDIARFVGIDRTATSRALRTMEHAGLLVRKAGTGDRRTTQVTLNAAGEALIVKGTRAALDNNEKMRGKLNRRDYEKLVALLSKIIEGEDADLSVL